MKTAISVRIPDKLAKELDLAAKITERTRSFLIQKALEYYLANQVDLQIALDRLNDASDPVISMGAMRKELNV